MGLIFSTEASSAALSSYTEDYVIQYYYFSLCNRAIGYVRAQVRGRYGINTTYGRVQHIEKIKRMKEGRIVIRVLVILYLATYFCGLLYTY